eukprot:comp24284_c0_seq1/m.45377 comp24284_c0_seq1/g.45377  ORF comp24284_c0_seq1/g.45377 comp24284_c0_seq1/m.45377 type:complete len:217 (-) comp24284_c0_seq1:2418-3068(-)
MASKGKAKKATPTVGNRANSKETRKLEGESKQKWKEGNRSDNYSYPERQEQPAPPTQLDYHIRTVGPPCKQPELALLAECVAIEKKTFPKHESMAETMKAEVEKRVNRWLVAVSQSAQASDVTVVGYLIYSLAKDGARVLKVVVDKQYQRQGIGRALLSEAESQVRASNGHRIALHVDPARGYAVGLYTSAGFKVVETVANYYKEGRDAHIMEKEL